VGAVVAVLAWTHGRSRAAIALRGVIGAVNSDVRRARIGRGLGTGAVGRWLFAQRESCVP
jgi:hypothetical protein